MKPSAPRKVPSRKHQGDPGYNRASKKHLAARLAEQKCIELRLEGLTYAEIAAKIGYSAVGVRTRILKVLDAELADTKSLVPRCRQIEIKRLDTMNQALWKKVKQGHLPAIQTALKIAERRARLCGLDAELNIHHSGSIDSKISIDLFRTMMTDATAKPQIEDQPGTVIDVDSVPIDIPIPDGQKPI